MTLILRGLRASMEAGAVQSYAMSQHLPDATVLLYSDAGHAFLFQRPQEFAAVVLDFLAKE